MAHRHLRLQIALIDKFDIEDQISLGRNCAGTAPRAIGKLPGNEEPPLAAYFHAGESLVKAGN